MKLTKGNKICPNCKTPLTQTPGKRAKEFCDSNCRSNYWQKQQRLAKKEAEEVVNNLKSTNSSPNSNGKLTITKGNKLVKKIKVEIRDLSKPTGKKVVSDPPPKTNHTINTMLDRAAGLRKIKSKK